MDLFRYTKDEREELVDVFQISRGEYTIVGENEDFIIAYLKEPTIKFDDGFPSVSTMFPRDFSAVRRFYTSTWSRVNATLKFYYVSADKTVNYLLDGLKRIDQNLNFDLYVEPIPNRNYREVGDGIISALKSIGVEGNKANIIVGGVLGSTPLEPYFFEKVKALSIINRTPTHLININKLDKVMSECKNMSNPRRLHGCRAFRAYILNNIVQLYAKAGGIPWIPGEERLLGRIAIVGIATARMKMSDREEYVVGAAFSIAYLGKETRSYITASIYDRSKLDEDLIKSKGIYVPRETIESLISKVADMYNKWQINQYIIFQSPIVHSEELIGLKEALYGRKWVLVHVKTTGFSKRVYDKNTLDWGPYRGMCILDKDYVNAFGKRGIIKAILTSTGRVKIRRRGEDVEEVLYKATPRPLELEIHMDAVDVKNYKEPSKLAMYISRLVLLLSKLDWEAYTNWPKKPFVIKYAQRLAQVIARIDEETRKRLLNTLTSSVALRFIM
jgi:hypothetical protein